MTDRVEFATKSSHVRITGDKLMQELMEAPVSQEPKLTVKPETNQDWFPSKEALMKALIEDAVSGESKLTAKPETDRFFIDSIDFNAKDVSSTILEEFDNLDKDKDGRLSKSELADGIKNSVASGDLSKAGKMFSVLRPYEAIAHLSDDDPGVEQKISKSDIANLDRPNLTKGDLFFLTNKLADAKTNYTGVGLLAAAFLVKGRTPAALFALSSVALQGVSYYLGYRNTERQADFLNGLNEQKRPITSSSIYKR